jgi:hypothetical protein
MPQQTGKRQGNPQLGLEICPHTCGCVITANVAKKLRRKPEWLRYAPIFVIDGHHSRYHIKNSNVHPNCSSTCSKLESSGRELTKEEYTAWAPHLGHLSELHKHIPKQYHPLFPNPALEDNYSGVLPSHPLPIVQSPSAPHDAMGSMSIQSPSSDSDAFGFSIQSSASASTSSTLPGRLLFIESPRLLGYKIDLETAQTLVTYDRYVIRKEAPRTILMALRTAPPGYAFQEQHEENDPNPDIESYIIHDMASIASFI